MGKSYHKFYFTVLGVLIALSAYPMIMGIKIIILQYQNGSIRPEDYARYVIPYTAICVAILISVALYPVIARLKGLSTLVATSLGLILFVVLELFMEGITINSPTAKSTVQWQLLSCIGTPDAVRAFRKAYSDAYKIHYFLVSFVIIVLVIGIVYGYGRLVARGDRLNQIPLRLQLIAVAVLLTLCVFANFTGFFRDVSPYLSPLSAFLTAMFFIVLGVTAGIYAGSRLIGKNKGLSLGFPAFVAILVCSVMYYGEFKLLDGKLYSFGQSYFFTGIPYIAVSPVDMVIIIVSGIITALLMNITRKKYFHFLTDIKDGNTERLVRLIEEQIIGIARGQNVALELEKVSLGGLDIQTCRGCRVCFDKGEAKCPLKDDLLTIRDKILQTDGMIVASPVYVEDVNGIMKNWIDRMAFICHRPVFAGKTAIVVTTSGIGSSNHALKTISTALHTWGVHVAAQSKFRTGALMKSDEIDILYHDKIKKVAAKFFDAIINNETANPSFFMENFKSIYKVTEEFISDNPTFVVEEDESIIGFYGILNGDKEASLEYLYVEPKSIGKG